MPDLHRLCVFCGSSPGAREEYATAARVLGATLAERGIGLVYGGASIGIMGLIADCTLAQGGEVIGVIPRALADKEIAHHGLSALHLVASMHERKAKMADLADGFIALPGGFGTLEEFFEVITWAQLGMHPKPCALLNVAGYYDRLLDFVAHMGEQAFIKPVHQQLILTDPDPHHLLDQMAAYAPPDVEKWLDRDST